MTSNPVAPARTLVVMRHAKAEPDGPSDYERRLADRGRRDADRAGAWLAEQGVQPDCALVSAAVRTEQTWASVSGGAGWDLDPTLDRGLYAAGPDTALDLIRGVDDACRTVVAIGHNPTMGTLAQILDDGEGDVEAGTEMATGFPTSAIAVFTFDGSWADLAPGTARVQAYHVGRG